MNFYTLRAAIHRARSTGKGQLFWIPMHGRQPASEAPNLWCRNPSGRKKEAKGITEHSVSIWITPKGEIWTDTRFTYGFNELIPKLLKMEHPSDKMEIRYSDLTTAAKDRYLRFRGALQEEELNLVIEPIAVLER